MNFELASSWPGLVAGSAQLLRRSASREHTHGRRFPLCERRLIWHQPAHYGSSRRERQENHEKKHQIAHRELHASLLVPPQPEMEVR